MHTATASDERAVSWKVLLPHGPQDRVLALGMNAADLAGLRRIFARLDTVIGNGPYDLLVVGKTNDTPAQSLQDLGSLLAPHGTLVTVGGNSNGTCLNGTDLSLFKAYAALPPQRPRVFVPLDSRRATLEALSMHAAGSTKARAALSVARTLRRLGLQRHLHRNVVSFYRWANANADTPGLLPWLRQKLGYGLTDLIAYTGAESERRKITALALGCAGRPDVIVKIADSPQGVDAIRQESEALAALAGSPLALRVPRLLLEGQYNSYSIQVQTKASGKRCRQIARLTHDHLEFLSQLSMVSRREVKVEDTESWSDLKAAAGDPSCEGMPDYVRVLFNRILSLERAQMHVVCHRIHGDFAPWNIRANRRQFFVFDWEDSEPTGLPFTDLFHFIYRQASLIGPWHSAGRLLAKMKEATTTLAQSAGIPVEQTEVGLQIWALREYLAHPSDHIEDVLRQIAGGIW